MSSQTPTLDRFARPLRANSSDYLFAALVLVFGAAIAVMPFVLTAPKGAGPLWLYPATGVSIALIGLARMLAVRQQHRRLSALLDSWQYCEWYRNRCVTSSLIGQSLWSTGMSAVLIAFGSLCCVWFASAPSMRERWVPTVLLLVAALGLLGIWARFYRLAWARAYFLGGGQLASVEGRLRWWRQRTVWKGRNEPIWLQVGTCRFAGNEMSDGIRFPPLPGVARAWYVSNGSAAGAENETWNSGVLVAVEWRRLGDDELRGWIQGIVTWYRETAGSRDGARVESLCREFEVLESRIGPQLQGQERMQLEQTLDSLQLYLTSGLAMNIS